MNRQIDVKRMAPPAVSHAWNSFRLQMDDLFDQFSDGFETYALKPFSELENAVTKRIGGFAPLAVDVVESDKEFVITAELPGVDERDVEVSVSDGMLAIRGEKRQEHEEKSADRYLSERSYGNFQRMFGLPRGTDEGKVEARFHNGVLSVTIPKPAAKLARKVDVKAA